MNSFVNINVNSLFEQYNIKEIEYLNGNIQNEVDGKKEELRTMVKMSHLQSLGYIIFNSMEIIHFKVGERYRDLIQAADTITEMKFTCAKIENVINQNELVISRKALDKKNLSDSSENFNDIYETSVQIKIQMNLVESISDSLDEHNFLEACQLFILSRHIHACLKLDSHSNMTKKFPVAQKIWDLISPFQNTIKSSCLKALEQKNINVEKAVDCLGSLILLENGEYMSALKTFIQLRERTLFEILTEEKDAGVKERLFDSVTELLNTTQIIYSSFVNYNGNEGLLIQKLSFINADDNNYVDRNSYLKNVKLLSRFKFHFNTGLLENHQIIEAVSSWLESVGKIIQDNLESVAKLIVSINTIREIENQVENIEKPHGWQNICSTLFNSKDVNFYDMFYQSIILKRMYKIVNISWESIQNDFKDELDKLAVSINDRVHRQSSYYIWMNDDTDNPQSLKDALDCEPKTHKLLMKVKGYNKFIVDICAKLDMNLKKVTEDLIKYILAKAHTKKALKSESAGDEFKEKLLSFLSVCSTSNIKSLVEYMKSTVLLNDVENCHILARLLQAISEMCPNLKKCFSRNPYPTAYFEGSVCEDSDQWKEVTQFLTSESMLLWRMWLTGFFSQWSPLKTEASANGYNILKEFPTWKSLIISENGENDQKIDSRIYIPQQLSITTQYWIFNTINGMNKMIPHTLPKLIHSEIVQELNKMLSVYYSSLCTQDELISNQKIAWQIFFDIKVLTSLFTIRENKTELENYQELASKCKSIIDPFDYDVFYPHVINNIKDNVFRLQYEMGLMVPYGNYSLLHNQSVIHVHDTEPNIISMSVCNNEKSWIPLLPIITKSKGFLKEPENVKVTFYFGLNEQKSQFLFYLQQLSQQSKKTLLPTNPSSSALSTLQEWFK